MQIELPPKMEVIARDLAERAGAENVEQFVLEMLCKLYEMNQVPEEALSGEYIEEKIQEALDSGPATPLTSDDFEQIRNSLRAQQAATAKP